MKKLFIAIFLIAFNYVNAQIVNIPDANFKNALIEVGVDTNNDGEIQTSEAQVVLNLNVGFKDISSLEGIQSFINLEVLHCTRNQLTNLDMSQNINLHLLGCSNNQINNLTLNQNINLSTLVCDNNQLSELNISENINLEALGCFSNQLKTLDLSQNINLRGVVCSDNQLNSLYLNNGNNQNMSEMISTGNVNLFCIQVDDENITFPECEGFPLTGWCKDDWSVYSEDCSLGFADVKDSAFSLYPNPAKSELFISSKTGKENLKVSIYSIQAKLLSNQNINIENQTPIDVSSLNSGIYFLNIEDEKGNTTVKKFIKQ